MTSGDKIKLLRRANNMTQADFAKALGISRGNLANIEIGKVSPTPLLINCISLMCNVSKDWLIDDNNEDLSELNGSVNMLSLIISKYEKLDDNYKKFVENQINQLLDIQNSEDQE
ncbi:MAG: helix-turn-helix domain-containing protein [Candidatus Gastranaerophilaceae bacterium]|nr:helix-turn-helix transcriptional regulator [Christensenellales bacterium]